MRTLERIADDLLDHVEGGLVVRRPPGGGLQIGRLYWPPAGKLWWGTFLGTLGLATAATVASRKSDDHPMK